MLQRYVAAYAVADGFVVRRQLHQWQRGEVVAVRPQAYFHFHYLALVFWSALREFTRSGADVEDALKVIRASP